MAAIHYQGFSLHDPAIGHIRMLCLCQGGDQGYAGIQQCYSVASAQRRSRTAEGAIPQAAGEDGQQNVSLHLENGVPVYQDMSINMQVKPVRRLSGVRAWWFVILSILLACQGAL